MSEKAEKKRFTVTLTGAYLDAANWLIEMGIYLDPQDVMRDALRQLFQFYKIDPFFPKLVEEAEDSSGR